MKALHFYIDEAGRGPLAGPLAVGVIVPLDTRFFMSPEGRQCQQVFQDSKKLSEKKREVCFEILEQLEKENKLLKEVSFSEVEEIDSCGMTHAQCLAIERGISACLRKGGFDPSQVDISLTLDGENDFGLQKRHPERNVSTLVKGDALIKEISMASIVAKVSRDRLMRSLPERYQKWGFAQHKGYGTQMHLERIREFGTSDQHRKLFLKWIFPDHRIQQSV